METNFIFESNEKVKLTIYNKDDIQEIFNYDSKYYYQANKISGNEIQAIENKE